MDKLVKLISDIDKLWAHYAGAYFTGIQNTLILAVAATLAGRDSRPRQPDGSRGAEVAKSGR